MRDHAESLSDPKLDNNSVNLVLLNGLSDLKRR